MVPGRCGCNVKLVIFKLIPRIDALSISCEIALMWMPQDLTDDLSILVQVMAWCRQATSHYLSQCQPKSISPYYITRPHCFVFCAELFCGKHKNKFAFSFATLKWQGLLKYSLMEDDPLIPCLLMTWWCKEPGHQQLWYWPISPWYSSLSTWRVTCFHNVLNFIYLEDGEFSGGWEINPS